MPNSKAELQSARNNKSDEFYTQLTIIEREMKHYKAHFKNKSVFCNCDDPSWSNFYRFFKSKFKSYGLKKLISTHFNYDENVSTYKLEFNGNEEIKVPLNCNGDFRSPECVNILDNEVDIVVTNPPFSLFREYMAQLINHDKKFIIMGNINSVFYKEIRPYFVNNEVWFGCTLKGQKPEFKVPENYGFSASKSNLRIDENGNKHISVQGVRWFTNLTHQHRREKIILCQEFNPKLYPKYDNYDAIDISKVKEIPDDYNGEMGVPITFLDKYNPEQFEIIGFSRDVPKSNLKYGKMDLFVNGKSKYARIIIKHRKESSWK